MRIGYQRLSLNKWTIVVYFCFELLTGCSGSESDSRRVYQEIRINGTRVQVEVVSGEKNYKGLSGRVRLRVDTGMLFVYPCPQILTFWMKDTYIPLSIAFIQSDGKITEIQDMAAYNGFSDHLLPRVQSSTPVRYALEMQKGWFAEKNITPGDMVILPRSLQ